MHDPASQAAIRRVTGGDHSPEAIAQLLTVMVVCQEATRDDVADIKAAIATLAANYANCPARHGAKRKRISIAELAKLAKLVLWCLLGLIALLAAAHGVALPFS